MSRALLALVVAASVTIAGCPYLDRPGGVGAQAEDFLRNPGELVVELDKVSGADPNSEALSVLTSTLRDVTGRNVRVEQNAQLPGKGANYSYSFQELADMAERFRDIPAERPGDVIHMLYVEGDISGGSGDGRVIGVAFNGVNIAMAKGTIRDASCAPNEEVLGRCLNGQPKERNVERAVLVHEAGHLLGLVNQGIPMVRDHEDPNHPGHSKFEGSVMYWQVENPGQIQNLFEQGDGIPYRFDEFDREDLRNAKQGGGS